MVNTQINVQDVTAAVGLVSTVLPQALAAYNLLKAAWLTANPDKTEADFLATLDQVSLQNVADADAILIKDGYTLGTDGIWVAPTPAGA